MKEGQLESGSGVIKPSRSRPLCSRNSIIHVPIELSMKSNIVQRKAWLASYATSYTTYSSPLYILVTTPQPATNQAGQKPEFRLLRIQTGVRSEPRPTTTPPPPPTAERRRERRIFATMCYIADILCATKGCKETLKPQLISCGALYCTTRHWRPYRDEEGKLCSHCSWRQRKK